jgi:Na+/melibiose symporter-like transporter
MPLITLIAYALPALPLAALTLPLYVIVPTFYTETLGLPLATVGAALLGVRIFDAINDPLIGWLSDRWRPAIGRRRAFFLAALPLAGLSTVMLFWPPSGVTVGYLAFWGAVLAVGYTGVLLPYAAWGAELAGDYAERSRIAGFRESFTLIGTLAAIALPFAIGMDGGTGLHGLALLGLFVAAALVLFGGLAAILVPEPREYSVLRLDWRSGLGHMARNRPFLRLIAAFLINGLANGIPATLFLYFVSDRLEAADMRGPLLFVYFLCGIAGVPVAIAAARRFGKHRAWCHAMIFACAAFSFAPLLGAGDVWTFLAISILTGFTLGFDLTLPAAIQADVIDVDTAHSGEQRSGLYFAAWSLATKLSLALAVGLVFPLLSLFGFRAEAVAVNTPAALTALAVSYAWLPIIFKLLAVALMWNFPVDQSVQIALRQEIEKRTGR